MNIPPPPGNQCNQVDFYNMNAVLCIYERFLFKHVKVIDFVRKTVM